MLRTIANIITYIAATAFIVSLCSVDSNSLAPIVVLLISGGWLLVYSYIWEENRRRTEGR